MKKIVLILTIALLASRDIEARHTPRYIAYINMLSKTSRWVPLIGGFASGIQAINCTTAKRSALGYMSVVTLNQLSNYVAKRIQLQRPGRRSSFTAPGLWSAHISPTTKNYAKGFAGGMLVRELYKRSSFLQRVIGIPVEDEEAYRVRIKAQFNELLARLRSSPLTK